MYLNLHKKNKLKKLYLKDCDGISEDNDVTITIKSISPGRLSKITGKYIAISDNPDLNFNTKKDLFEAVDDTFREVVVGWSGVKESENGPEIACTDENKKLFFDEYPSVSIWVINQLVQFIFEIGKNEEDEKKTL